MSSQPSKRLRLFLDSNVLTGGIDNHTVERVQIRVTSAARTVADCFKFRNKIGIDVAVEALRDFMKSRGRRDLNEIYRYAQLDRVQSVIRPYLEAMT